MVAIEQMDYLEVSGVSMQYYSSLDVTGIVEW